MGTNYFLAKKVDDVVNLHDADDLQRFLDDYPLIHLCKFSAGWHILWDSQDWEVNDINYFKQDDYVVVDEYHIKHPRFWEEVDKWESTKGLKSHTDHRSKHINGVDWSTDFL